MRRVRRLRLRREAIRELREPELRQIAAGLRATSEAIDTYPCPGEYSYFCKP